MEAKHSSDLKGALTCGFIAVLFVLVLTRWRLRDFGALSRCGFFPQAWLMATAMCSDADAPVCANKHSHEHKHREIQSVCC